MHSGIEQTSQLYIHPSGYLYLLHLYCILCRALLRRDTSIPECRRLELLDTVAQYCDCSSEDVTDEMIQRASEINPKCVSLYISTRLSTAHQNTSIVLLKSLVLKRNLMTTLNKHQKLT